MRQRTLDADFSQDPALRRDGRLTQAQLDSIIRGWRRRLRLEGWRIHVMVDVEIEGGDAQIKVHDDYEQATLQFAHGWNRWTERYANAVVVHELLHILENGVGVAVESLEAISDSASTWKMIEARYGHEAEALVDRLAWILVDVGGLV